MRPSAGSSSIALRTLPGALHRSAVACFGERGTAELVFLIARYAAISMVLNTYDAPLPPDAE
ncbi:hypothetical protein DP939_06185 [Spongiactinospora rosea]|uniref:Uncharacterized protein n=1 Tax=Spongiactinospora rosea TaxID=2248750 RepID=A0A366M4I4_9ACTN|nr:hypothetical protein [Spongiactinospora rosea]RBQ20670.1 hypothetical protein DP939_06185 [Spongiactinospora rosea]